MKYPASNNKKLAYTWLLRNVYACRHSPDGGVLASVCGKLETLNMMRSCFRVAVSGIQL